MTVVFKLGGSLLNLPGLADRLQRVVDLRIDHGRLVVTGGGATADVVREWSRIHKLDEETAHWLAISSLDLNRAFVETQLPWKSVVNREEASSLWNQTQVPVQLNFDAFVRVEEREPGEPLPHNWNVTTDSLAAWTALRWPASELILLKSIPIPHRLTAQQAADQSLVDGHFPRLAKKVTKISWCDLRNHHLAIETWLEHPEAATA